MHPFSYPNSMANLIRAQVIEEMEKNIGRKIKFTIYNSKGFPAGEKTGTIHSVVFPDYIAKVGRMNYAVSKDDYISIF